MFCVPLIAFGRSFVFPESMSGDDVTSPNRDRVVSYRAVSVRASRAAPPKSALSIFSLGKIMAPTGAWLYQPGTRARGLTSSDDDAAPSAGGYPVCQSGVAEFAQRFRGSGRNSSKQRVRPRGSCGSRTAAGCGRISREPPEGSRIAAEVSTFSRG